MQVQRWLPLRSVNKYCTQCIQIPKHGSLLFSPRDAIAKCGIAIAAIRDDTRFRHARYTTLIGSHI